MTSSEFRTARCVNKWSLFDAVEVEDANGELIGEHYPYEDTAKALCADCPVFDLCEIRYGSLPTGIIAGKRPDERRRKRGRAA